MSEFKNYLLLRAEIDLKVELLVQQHSINMICKKGCDSCCYGFKVFPVEFYAIKKAAELKGDYNMDDEIEGNERCQFLHNHQCTIYQSRPIICRTHGIPLFNMNNDGTDWELSVCELNFTDIDENYFNEENVFMQDTYNSKLFQINKQFLETHPELDYSEFDLIPLKSLYI